MPGPVGSRWDGHGRLVAFNPVRGRHVFSSTDRTQASADHGSRHRHVLADGVWAMFTGHTDVLPVIGAVLVDPIEVLTTGPIHDLVTVGPSRPRAGHSSPAAPAR